jgi:hypothetical protein
MVVERSVVEHNGVSRRGRREMRSAKALIVFAIFVCSGACVAGCGSDRPVREPSRLPAPIAPGATQMAVDRDPIGAPCAAHTPDTRVGAQITERGAALVFTTSDDDVATLRRRAADVTVPTSLQKAGPRVDNIHQGVRLVFDAEPPHDLAALRQEVVEHARRVAKGCGLVLAAPSEHTQSRARQSSEQKQGAERPPAAASSARPKAKPAKEKPPEAKAEKPKAKPKASEKPKLQDKPKPADKPKEPSKPREDKQPKEDKKPTLPRLPGPHPDPILPSLG